MASLAMFASCAVQTLKNLKRSKKNPRRQGAGSTFAEPPMAQPHRLGNLTPDSINECYLTKIIVLAFVFEQF